jgi:hypothetical protein
VSLGIPESIASSATGLYWRQGGEDYGWPDLPGVVDVEVWMPFCERCEGYGVVSEMAPCTTFGPDCGCNERIDVVCPDCDGVGA